MIFIFYTMTYTCAI